MRTPVPQAEAPEPLDFTLTGSPLFIIGTLVERINELAGGSDNLKLVVSATMHVHTGPGPILRPRRRRAR